MQSDLDPEPTERKQSLKEAVDMVRQATLDHSRPENTEKSLVPALPVPVYQKPTDLKPHKQQKTKKQENPSVYKVQMFDCVEHSLRRGLWYLNQTIATYPFLFIIIPLILTAMTMIGLIVHKDTLNFHAPFHSFYAKKHVPTSAFYANLGFNSTNPHYNALIRVSPTDYAVILKTPKGTSVLREEVVDRYFTIKGTMETIKVTSGNKMLKYSTLCRDAQASCQEDVVEKIMTSGKSVSLTYPETLVTNSNKNLTRIFIGTTFGGVETDHEGSIAQARALAMYFRLKKNTPLSLVNQWNKAFQNQLSGVAGRGENITWWSYGGFLDAVGVSFRKLYKSLGYAVLVTAICCVLVTFAPSSYRSKPWAGLSVFAAVGFSHLSSVGIHVGISGYLNVTSFPAFFTFCATGIFLLLVLLQSWRKFSNIAVHPKEKLMFMLSWDGPCVVGCCIAGIVAYMIAGVATTLPYFRYLLLLNGFSMIFLLVFTLLFFSAVLFLTGKREAAGVKWFMFWQPGDTHFPLPLTHRFNEKDLLRLHHKLADQQPSFARNIGAGLGKVHFRYIAFLVFAIYSIFAVWGCTIAPINLKEDDFLSKQSDPSKFLRDYREFYGRYERYLELSFEDVVDYMDPKYRDAILSMLDWAQEQQFVNRIVSWLRDFMRFEQSSIYLVNRDTFVPVVNLVYLQTDRYKQYSADIAFDKYQAQIVSSRMYMELSHKGRTNHLGLIDGLLARAKKVGLPLRIRTPSIFLVEHDIQLKPAFVIAFCILLCLMSVTGLVFFCQPLACLISALCTVSVAAGTIGYGALWNVSLNAPTVGIVLTGLLYTAVTCFTLCYHFSNCGSDKTPKQRMEYAFQSSLWPTIWSTVVPILGYIPLLLVSSCPLVSQLGKLLVLHLVFTLSHYLLFLPPCLMLLVQNLPQCCDVLQELCDETCCVCCDNEEDSTSIYYIPTTGRTLDRDGLQQYFSHSMRKLPPLPIPRNQKMILPPPLVSSRPDLIMDDFDPHSPRVHSSGYGSLPRSFVDPRGSPPPRERERYFGRPRSVSPCMGAYRVVETPEPRITSPAPSVKPTAREEEKKSIREEDIYEEPPADSPANSLASGSIYIVKKGKEGRHNEMKRMSKRQREADKEKERDRDRDREKRVNEPPLSRNYDRHLERKRWSREYHRPESYHSAYDDYDPHIEALRPGWKQYYLDGALRQPLPDAPPRRRPRGVAAYPPVIPADIPDHVPPGRLRASYHAPPFRHREPHVPGPPPLRMGPRPAW